MIEGVLFGYNEPSSGAHADGSSARQATRDFSHLEDRLERLSLVCMAMWSLLQDKTQLTEEDLLERVKLIDMMDGKPDGKATTTVKKCHACQRTLHPRHRKCLYCGATMPVLSAFDSI
jgi:hypothetical protein